MKLLKFQSKESTLISLKRYYNPNLTGIDWVKYIAPKNTKIIKYD